MRQSTSNLCFFDQYFYQDIWAADTLQLYLEKPVMLKASKSQPKLNACVQIFSGLVEMKFKPVNEKGTEAIARRKQKQQKGATEDMQLYDPLSMVLHADRKIQQQQLRRLKFIASLSADHFIIGNQNQIDMISFGAVAHGFVDTDYFWSLNLKNPIQSITVDAKKSIFLLLSDSIVYFYRYNTKSKQLPSVVAQITLYEKIKFIRCLKDGLLGIFYSSRYEIYNIQNLNLIKKKLDKAYPVGPEKILLTIPPSIDNIINIFFQQPKQNKQSFILWCLQLNFEGQQIRTRQPYRVYDVMNYVKGKLSIQNYTKEIIFMNLKNQIMAIKNGYLIDTVNVSVNEEGEVLKYIHPQTILHITKKNVQVYNFSINMSVKPQKIVLKSIDSIQLVNIPQNAFYITVLQTTSNNFAIFFQDSQKKKYQTKGEITYYFQISESTTIKQKISSIFESINIGIANPENIEEKYNMAKKMGLTEKQIYLEIWNRSNKSTLADYQFILATRDYKTIKLEIQKKLKKQSMALREILKIEEGCLQINRQKIEGPNCNEEDLQDFVTSHFLMRKFKLYRQINVIQRMSSIINSEDSSIQGKSLKIDIQHYYFFKNAQIKGFIIDQITDMLFSLKNNAKIIRIIINHLKFSYRIIYKELLQQIIKNTKQEMINLLNEIPEILPYIHKDLNDEQMKSGLFDGVWGDIKPKQWQQCLYPENIQTLHNKQILAQFINSIWFKRFWLTSHDMVNKTTKQIIKINQHNNSQKIFYYFISKFYEHNKANKPYYYQVIGFLQEKYELFPSHLINKCYLYENLYIYYYHEQMNNSKKYSFAQFLELDDQRLFKYFFDHQKIKKNSLLKEIKPIYQQSDSNGSHIFNIGLFSYFYSDLSEISDLKFILNRINNQKTEFHQKNYGIYQVLVRSMQLKLKLGAQKCIPMDQVMIYIQNIPLDKNNQIMIQLYIMQNIKEQASLFNRMKINMSVKQIMDGSDLVIGKIIDFLIGQEKVTQISGYQEFKRVSYRIINEAERIKRKIYGNQQSNFILLIYITIVLEAKQMIGKVATFLEDETLHQLYHIEEKTIENIVLYMYKWVFSKNSKYLHNEQYLRNLLELLPQESSCRIFLESQLDLAIMLSTEENPIDYPLSKKAVSPSLRDIQTILRRLTDKHLLSIDPEKCYNLMDKLQKNSHGQTKNDRTLSLYKIYQIYVVSLLDKNLYAQAIDQIHKVSKVQSRLKHGIIIFVIIMVYKIVGQFNQESKKTIFKLVALLFFEPIKMLQILDFSIKTKLTGLEQTKYLKEIYNKQNQMKSNFNRQNTIFCSQFANKILNPHTKEAVQRYRALIKSKRQDFQRKNEYDLIFTILCQQPYFLPKLLDLQRESINLRGLKSFLISTCSRDIFHHIRVLELLKRIFVIIAISIKQEKDIDLIIHHFKQKSLEEDFQIPKVRSTASDYEKKLFKIANSFSRYQNNAKKRLKSDSYESYRKKHQERLRKLLENPNIIDSQYVQVEQSQDEKNISMIAPSTALVVNNNDRIPFTIEKQRTSILKRTIGFKQFITGKQYLVVEHKDKDDNGILPDHILLKTAKSNDYLQVRNSLIHRLYSHKVVNKSEYNDDPQARKEDEEFLDSFIPNLDQSKDSGSSLHPRQSKKQSRVSPNLSKVNQIDRQKEVEQLVRVLDAELGEENNIQIGSYHSIVQQQPSQKEIYQKLKDKLFSTFNQTRIPKFELLQLDQHLQLLSQNQSQENYEAIKKQKQLFLINFVKFLYNNSPQDTVINIKLIQEIARKHPQAGINHFFLQAYQRIYATHEKYGLDLNISSIMPVSGIFIRSKDIVDLFHEVQPYIIAKITDQNIFKLSKLIALGFRKNVVEQEILFKYAKMKMNEFLKIGEEEKKTFFQKIRSIWQKFQTNVLVEKGLDLFEDLEKGDRRDYLLNSFAESLKNKGYASASRELISKLNG